MNRRFFISAVVGIICVGTLWGIMAQKRQLMSLRAEHERLQAQEAASPTGSQVTEALAEPQSNASPSVSSELLRLRSEITRLTERKRALTEVVVENGRLRDQLASRATNASVGTELPPGFVLASQTRMVGYNTPEDTLQSLVWAVHNHDFTNVLQAFTPASAQVLQGQAGRVPKEAAGFLVLQQRAVSPTRVELTVEVVPGAPPEQLPLELVDGQWKIDILGAPR